eukprot:1525856-Amphidinium_carterae.1
MPPKFRLVVWQNAEYLEVRVAGANGTVCSIVLEVVWVTSDTNGCTLDVRLFGASHPVGQQWIEQQKMSDSFPQFHRCSKRQGLCTHDT